MSGLCVHLDELELQPVVAHGGEGRILFRRVFDGPGMASACNFVDYAVLPPGSSIGTHRHGDDEEIYVVLEGEGTMLLDGVERAVRPGSIILNRPGGTHGLVNRSNGPIRIVVVEIAAPPGSVRESEPARD